MKKISCLAILLIAIVPSVSGAASRDKMFRREVSRGLDIVGADVHMDAPDVAYGQLGADVYGTVPDKSPSSRMFIPTSMYVRMGGGLNFGPATDGVSFAGTDYDARGGYVAHIGLGWNLSSFVRGEIDFMTTALKFKDLDNYRATYNGGGAMLYFDLARRYVMSGDITYRRRVVPFIGLGASVNAYQFQGPGGADGIAIAAPRAAFGLNVRMTDLLSLDLAYQYQMMIGHGYGWDDTSSGVNNISNIIASIRAEF